MSKARKLYLKLKETGQLEEFCNMAETTPENLRQIIWHNGAISRKLSIKLAGSCARLLGAKKCLKPSDFLFPDGNV